MAKSKHKLANTTFKALRGIDAADGARIEPGDTFKGSRFPHGVLNRWLKRQPPVIRKVKGGG